MHPPNAQQHRKGAGDPNDPADSAAAVAGAPLLPPPVPFNNHYRFLSPPQQSQIPRLPSFSEIQQQVVTRQQQFHQPPALYHPGLPALATLLPPVVGVSPSPQTENYVPLLHARHDSLDFMMNHAPPQHKPHPPAQYYYKPPPTVGGGTPTPNVTPMIPSSTSSSSLSPQSSVSESDLANREPVSGSVSGPPDMSKIKYRRTRKACDLCSQKRTKCSGDTPCCSQCLKTNSVCTYLRMEKKRGRASSNYPKIIIRRKPTKHQSLQLKNDHERLFKSSTTSTVSWSSKTPNLRYVILNHAARSLTELQVPTQLACELLEAYFETTFPTEVVDRRQTLGSEIVKQPNEGFVLSMLLTGLAQFSGNRKSQTETVGESGQAGSSNLGGGEKQNLFNISKEQVTNLLDLLLLKVKDFLHNSTKLDRDDIVSHINLAKAYLLIGQPTEAFETVNVALGLALKLKVNVGGEEEEGDEKRRIWGCLIGLEGEAKQIMSEANDEQMNGEQLNGERSESFS